MDTKGRLRCFEPDGSSLWRITLHLVLCRVTVCCYNRPKAAPKKSSSTPTPKPVSVLIVWYCFCVFCCTWYLFFPFWGQHNLSESVKGAQQHNCNLVILALYFCSTVLADHSLESSFLSWTMGQVLGLPNTVLMCFSAVKHHHHRKKNS